MDWFYIILNIWKCYFNFAFLRYWFVPLIALAFLCTVPRLFRSLVTWR